MRLQRFTAAVVVVIVTALGVILAVAKVFRLTPVSIIRTTFVSADYSKDIVSAHPPPRDAVYGAHNFRRPNHVITDYDRDVAARLATLVEPRSTAADPDLIRLIVDMLDPPSSRAVKMSRQLFSTPQSREVDSILQQKVRRSSAPKLGALGYKKRSNYL